MTDPRPIYQQLADGIRDQIADGSLPEGERAPSTNELSAFHSVNPTTSAKALTSLVDAGLLTKRRGLGMFVVPGARQRVLDTRREAFAATYLRPLLAEARALGIGDEELRRLIDTERALP